MTVRDLKRYRPGSERHRLWWKILFQGRGDRCLRALRNAKKHPRKEFQVMYLIQGGWGNVVFLSPKDDWPPSCEEFFTVARMFNEDERRNWRVYVKYGTSRHPEYAAEEMKCHATND